MKQAVESVVVINPGHLSKRKGAGTYAHMTLHPPKLTEEARGAQNVAHEVAKRARVEIRRI